MYRPAITIYMAACVAVLTLDPGTASADVLCIKSAIKPDKSGAVKMGNVFSVGRTRCASGSVPVVNTESFSGASGPKGDKGDRGDAGPKGDQGPVTAAAFSSTACRVRSTEAEVTLSDADRYHAQDIIAKCQPNEHALWFRTRLTSIYSSDFSVTPYGFPTDSSLAGQTVVEPYDAPALPNIVDTTGLFLTGQQQDISGASNLSGYSSVTGTQTNRRLIDLTCCDVH